MKRKLLRYSPPQVMALQNYDKRYRISACEQISIPLHCFLQCKLIPLQASLKVSPQSDTRSYVVICKTLIFQRFLYVLTQERNTKENKDRIRVYISYYRVTFLQALMQR